jgi:hypothetical protein
MIFEVTFCVVFILASRAIANIYYRRRDVLYGPYRAQTRGRRSKAHEWNHQNLKLRDSGTGGRRLEVFSCPCQITPVETIFLRKRSGEIYRLPRQEKRP